MKIIKRDTNKNKKAMVEGQLLKLILAVILLLVVIGIIFVIRGELGGQEGKIGDAFIFLG